jgi:hypothetical protein
MRAARLAAPSVPLALLAACGDGNNTIFTGFSGVVIFVLIVWAVLHFVRK